jgi:DNA-binding GntR family transcriptional regulator
MPCVAWVEQKKRSGGVITDYLAAQIAGHYLKQAVESGYDNGREMYTMSVAEVLEHLDAVMAEARHTELLPSLPVLAD